MPVEIEWTGELPPDELPPKCVFLIHIVGVKSDIRIPVKVPTEQCKSTEDICINDHCLCT